MNKITSESSELLTNYFTTITPPLHSDIKGKFSSVAHPEKETSELISLANNGDIIHLYEDSKSQSSFAKDQSPFPGNNKGDITSLTSFYLGPDLYLFAIFKDKDSTISYNKIAMKKKWSRTLERNKNIGLSYC